MSRRSPRVPACALALALLAGAALPAAAQEPGATATFGDETAVTLVELPVEVTRDGAAVGGLTAGDFVVTERGRELPVVSFEEVTLGAGGGEASPAMPSLAARRHVFLLFDLAFSRPERVRRGVAEARDFVGRLDPSDVVAVGVYSPGGELAILSSFSGDHRASLRTLDTLAAALDARPAAGAAGAAPGDPLRLTGTGAEHLLAAAWPIDERNISGEALAGLGQPARTFSSGNSVSAESRYAAAWAVRCTNSESCSMPASASRPPRCCGK